MGNQGALLKFIVSEVLIHSDHLVGRSALTVVSRRIEFTWTKRRIVVLQPWILPLHDAACIYAVERYRWGVVPEHDYQHAVGVYSPFVDANTDIE